jgi:hypothetical protein
MQLAEQGPEHRWLQRLVGDWTFEAECQTGPDSPPEKNTGRETVRSMGGLWTVGEGFSDMPGGEACSTIMTLGYDPRTGRFVGTFLVAFMTHLWHYDGKLDGNVLTLDTEGPNVLDDSPAMFHYQDSIEFVNDDHRILSSRVRGSDGQWQHFMTAHYRRKN